MYLKNDALFWVKLEFLQYVRQGLKSFANFRIWKLVSYIPCKS